MNDGDATAKKLWAVSIHSRFKSHFLVFAYFVIELKFDEFFGKMRRVKNPRQNKESSCCLIPKCKQSFTTYSH